MRLIALFLIFAGSVYGQSAPSCSCTNTSSDPTLEGGNGDPLRWHSVKHLYMPAEPNSPAWFCFERRVENKSDATVTDILWSVAGFERDEIPKQDSRCDATPLEGEELPHPKGPLNYGAGTKFYPTSVYAPKGGFQQAAGTVSKPTSTPELNSLIEITDPATGKPARIAFRSSVVPSGEDNRFRYEVTSSAAEKLLVFWYVPLTPEFKSLEMSGKIPLTAAPGVPVQRAARSSDPVGWTAASVRIADVNGRWLGTGIASVYCSLKGEVEPLPDAASRTRKP